ncbi:MAG TPA: hypothetical protein VF881_01685 [Polyangiaceae bacterium]
MYVSWQKLLVAGAALLFTGFLLWKYRPTLPLPRFALPWRRVRKTSVVALAEELRLARERARKASTPRERAEGLLAAAEAAARADNGVTSALGLYLRAMRADPTFCEPLSAVASLLRKDRPELLETVLWRRLSHLSWKGDTAPAARCAAEALASLYRRELRHRERAHALQKLVSFLA